METKHTLGPWSVPHFADGDGAHSCKCRYVLCDYYAGAIATIHVANNLPIGEGGNDDPPLAEAQANARLIAASPDLLEVLLAIEADALRNGTIISSDTLAKVRAAIAKATGQ